MQHLSDAVVSDPLYGRGILDLPAYGQDSAAPIPPGEEGGGGGPSGGGLGPITGPGAAGGLRPGSSRGASRGGSRGGGPPDPSSIRATVADNTTAVDLAFPTLEFRRTKRADLDAGYFAAGMQPAAFAVNQAEGAVWSQMARDRRAIERGGGLEGGGGPVLDPFQQQREQTQQRPNRPASRPGSRDAGGSAVGFDFAAGGFAEGGLGGGEVAADSGFAGGGFEDFAGGGSLGAEGRGSDEGGAAQSRPARRKKTKKKKAAV